MRLVNGVDKKPHRFFVKHIYVIGARRAGARFVYEENAVTALRKAEPDKAVLYGIRQPYRLRRAVFVLARPFVRENVEQDHIIVFSVSDDRRISARTHNVDVEFYKLPFAKLRVILYAADRVTRRVMVVVEHPDLHPALFTFGYDKIHIAPPRLTAEILMRTRLGAERAAAALVYALYLLRYFFVMVAPLPVKRQHIIVLAAV